MSHKRDALFPTGSLPRTGLQTPRNTSHESLTAHPLLSPTGPIPAPSGSSVAHTNSASTPIHDPHAPISAAPPTRYVPYTPRQRGASATTGTTTHTSVQAAPQQHQFHGDATSKLQVMNLKAAAQKGGLDTASTGWAILEKLGTETDQGPEWNEIWSAITTGRATLMLPMEAHPSNEPITAEFIKDHIALCDGASRNYAPIVTLSGLRGTLVEETLIVRSTLHSSTKSFQALLNPSTRASTLASLPPLPPTPPLPTSSLSPDPSLLTVIPPSSPSSTPVHTATFQYPTYVLPSHHPSLPLPPRPSHSTHLAPSKPPLPPRPSRTTPTSIPHPAGASSRLSNPFASLFGRASTPPPPTASPTISPLPLHSTSPASPTTDNAPLQPDNTADQAIGVSAFTMERRIVRRDLAKTLLRAVRAELRASLSDAHAPRWVAERLEAFAETAGLMPFVKMKAAKATKKVGLGKHEDGGGGGYVVSGAGGAHGDAEELGRRVQEFYMDLEEELDKRRWGTRGFGRGLVGHLGGNGGAGPGMSSSESIDGDEKSGEREGEEKEEAEESPGEEKEKRIREVMEVVERTLCSLFYDRLLLQPSSDDATHDEALSSRIAAVNLLDLSLAHLGVDVGRSGPEVLAVVKACGETLTQLDAACRAPAEKAAVLVAAHKIIVDGLSRLPPIGLKPEEELLDEKTPRAATFGRRTAEEEEEDTIPPSIDIPVKSISILQDVSKTVQSPESESSSAEPPKVDDAPSESPAMSPEAMETVEHTPPPRLTISPAPPNSPTPVSGDIVLPLMIFAVVKANPPHLVSHLLYTQRFRNQAIGGEESYALINLLAVAEFLENVDLAALGLGESEKTVISTAELTPIPVARLTSEPSSHNLQPSLRGRVEQQVDAITGSANKVISGVVDSSFGVLRALLPGTANNESAPAAVAVDGELQESAPWNAARPGFGLLRRDTGFSIASLAASLPGASARAKKDEESGQQMVEVPSRPASSRSMHVDDAAASSSEASEGEESEDEEYEEEEGHDARSIRSFESMMSGRAARAKKKTLSGRKSITDRLASVPGLSRLSQGAPQETTKGSPPSSRRSSLLMPGVTQSANRFDTPASSRPTSPVAIRISAPNPRFLQCSEDDIKVSEVGELLREYKRLVEAVRAMGGFHED